MHLALDVETSGLPQFREPSDSPNQPHLVQLAMVLLDDDLVERGSASVIIKPEGWTIPDDVAAIHGITTEMATMFGVPEKQAVNLFMAWAFGTGATVIAHNSPFDLKLMRIAMLRAGRTREWLDANPIPSICTMKAATPIVAIPPTPKMVAAGFTKHKNASLSECIEFFFGEKLEGAHDAMVDVRACIRVHRHLTMLAEMPPIDAIGDVV